MDFISRYVIPQEISGNKLRVANLTSFSRFIYSKDGSFLFPKEFNDTELNSKEFKEYFDNFSQEVRYEIEAPTAVVSNKMKEKLFLNEQISKEFKNIMGYDSTLALKINDKIRIAKLFEVYSILDFTSNTVYFACVSVFPERDAPFILEFINGLRLKYNTSGIDIRISSPEYDTKELLISNKLHFLSFSADNSIENIRKLYLNDKWRIQLLNEEYFLKKETEYVKRAEQIILCEGQNKKLLNLLKLPDTIFSDEHNSLSIFQNVKTMELKCLRDKDFLTTDEVSKLKKKFPKYYILDYYCIENYLYHPENIFEYLNGDFNKEKYIEHIILDKDEKFENMSEKVGKSRNTYPELKENHISPTKDAESIILNELKSSEFRLFYKHFNMKSLNKTYLNKYNLNDKKLASTEWFRIRISSIIENRRN